MIILTVVVCFCPTNFLYLYRDIGSLYYEFLNDVSSVMFSANLLPVENNVTCDIFNNGKLT